MVSVITELYSLLVYIWEPNTRVKIALLQCVCVIAYSTCIMRIGFTQPVDTGFVMKCMHGTCSLKAVSHMRLDMYRQICTHYMCE